jgi:hypothetical protein
VNVILSRMICFKHYKWYLSVCRVLVVIVYLQFTNLSLCNEISQSYCFYGNVPLRTDNAWTHCLFYLSLQNAMVVQQGEVSLIWPGSANDINSVCLMTHSVVKGCDILPWNLCLYLRIWMLTVKWYHWWMQPIPQSLHLCSSPPLCILSSFVTSVQLVLSTVMSCVVKFLIVD